MERRGFLWLGLAAAKAPAGERDAARGRLIQNATPPGLREAGGRVVELVGDAETEAVLRDERLKDEDFEARGERLGPARLKVDPIHLRALYVHRQGKLLVVTYWCPVCAIRTYTPGKCGCCQEETQFDPRDPALADTDPSKSSPDL